MLACEGENRQGRGSEWIWLFERDEAHEDRSAGPRADVNRGARTFFGKEIEASCAEGTTLGPESRHASPHRDLCRVECKARSRTGDQTRELLTASPRCRVQNSGAAIGGGPITKPSRLPHVPL